jgi:hypothetical protein
MVERGEASPDDKNPSRLIIFKFDAALHILASGHLLAQSTSSPAMWFETEAGESTPYKCGWAIKHRMEKLGFIERYAEKDFRVLWKLSKLGQKTVEKILERHSAKKSADLALQKKQDAKLVTSKALPASRHENVRHEDIKDGDILPSWWPKTFTVYRSKDQKQISGTGYVIHGVVFAGGKTVICWVENGVVTTFDSFQQFENIHLSGTKHGEAVVKWFDEKRRAPKELLSPVTTPVVAEKPVAKERKRRCFYCLNGFASSAQGRKGWRDVCAAPACKKRYANDKAVRRELKMAGVGTGDL